MDVFILSDDGGYPEASFITMISEEQSSEEQQLNSISEVVFSIINTLKEFSNKYNQIKYKYNKKYRKVVNIPLDEISPHKYNKGITRERIEETVIEFEDDIFNYILNFFENESSSESGSEEENQLRENVYLWISDNRVHTIRHIKRYFNIKEPIILPITEISTYYEPSIILPNFQKKFWLLTNENVVAYQLHSVDNLLPIISDLFSSYIIVKYNKDIRFAIAVIMLLSAVYQSKEMLTYIVNNSSYGRLNELKNNSAFFDQLYDEIENLGRTNQLLRHIVNNFMNSILDINLTELLSIVLSKTSEEIENKFIDIKSRFTDAYAFMSSNKIPKIEILQREQTITTYFPLENGVAVTEDRERKTERPMNIVHDSSQNIISYKEYYSLFTSSLLSRNILIKDGEPVIIRVDKVTEETDYYYGYKIYYTTENSETELGNVYEISIYTTSWEDAQRIYRTINRIRQYQRYNEICKLQITKDSNIKSLIHQLFHNSFEFSLNYNTQDGEIVINYSGIDRM